MSERNTMTIREWRTTVYGAEQRTKFVNSARPSVLHRLVILSGRLCITIIFSKMKIIA
jgi:hypothetical protein